MENKSKITAFFYKVPKDKAIVIEDDDNDNKPEEVTSDQDGSDSPVTTEPDSTGEESQEEEEEEKQKSSSDTESDTEAKAKEPEVKAKPLNEWTTEELLEEMDEYHDSLTELENDILGNIEEGKKVARLHKLHDETNTYLNGLETEINRRKGNESPTRSNDISEGVVPHKDEDEKSQAEHALSEISKDQRRKRRADQMIAALNNNNNPFDVEPIDSDFFKVDENAKYKMACFIGGEISSNKDIETTYNTATSEIEKKNEFKRDWFKEEAHKQINLKASRYREALNSNGNICLECLKEFTVEEKNQRSDIISCLCEFSPRLVRAWHLDCFKNVYEEDPREEINGVLKLTDYWRCPACSQTRRRNKKQKTFISKKHLMKFTPLVSFVTIPNEKVKSFMLGIAKVNKLDEDEYEESYSIENFRVLPNPRIKGK